MDTKELSRDSSGTRAYAAFLLELSRVVPAIMLPSISVLLVLLDGEVGNAYCCLLCSISFLTSFYGVCFSASRCDKIGADDLVF